MAQPVEVVQVGDSTRVVLNRPERRNALDEETMRCLLAALRELTASGTRGVVLTGAPPAFSAGGDLGDLPPDRDAQRLADRHRVYVQVAAELCRLPLPTVAAVDGPAIGAGCSLALACDYVVLGPQAQLGVGFLDAALPPDLLAAALVQRRCGWTSAADLLYGRRRVGAAEAVALRLANEMVEAADGLLDRAHALAEGLARPSLQAFRFTKSMLLQAWPAVDALLDMEPLMVGLAAASAEFDEATARFRR